MRINHYIATDHGGGATTNTRRLIKKLDGYEHNVYVIFGDDNGFLYDGSENCSVHYLKCDRSLGGFLQLRRKLKETKKSGVNITNGFGCLLMGLLASFGREKRKWVHISRGANFHGKLSLVKWVLYRLISTFNFGLNFVFVSESERESFRKKLFLGKSNHFYRSSYIIGNGLSSEQFETEVPKSQGRGSKLLVVSRVCDQKDLLGLIRLLKNAVDIGMLPSDFSLDVMGSLDDAGYVKKCTQLISKYRLDGNISLLGEVKLKPDQLLDYKFMIHNPKFEGLATVLTEASAFGLPYVSRESVGTVDFKTSSNECLFYKDTKGFLACLRYLHYSLEHDPELVDWIAQENRKNVRSELVLEKTTEQLVDLLDAN